MQALTSLQELSAVITSRLPAMPQLQRLTMLTRLVGGRLCTGEVNFSGMPAAAVASSTSAMLSVRSILEPAAPLRLPFLFSGSRQHRAAMCGPTSAAQVCRAAGLPALEHLQLMGARAADWGCAKQLTRLALKAAPSNLPTCLALPELQALDLDLPSGLRQSAGRRLLDCPKLARLKIRCSE